MALTAAAKVMVVAMVAVVVAATVAAAKEFWLVIPACGVRQALRRQRTTQAWREAMQPANGAKGTCDVGETVLAVVQRTVHASVFASKKPEERVKREDNYSAIALFFFSQFTVPPSLFSCIYISQ